MRTWILDQFEFDNPASEESLTVSYVRSGRAATDVAAFVASTAGMGTANRLGRAMPFDERFAYGLVRAYLRRFTGLELPSPCDWPTYVLRDGPDDWEIILCGPDGYIRYLWSTTA